MKQAAKQLRRDAGTIVPSTLLHRFAAGATTVVLRLRNAARCYAQDDIEVIRALRRTFARKSFARDDPTCARPSLRAARCARQSLRVATLAAAMMLAACARPAHYDLERLYRRMHPSVVFLTMKAPSDDPKMHGKIDDAYGTAFVISSGDWGTRIITAKHVIDDAHNVRAHIGDATRGETVRIIAQDDREDLALLEVSAVKNAPAVELSDAPAVVPGEAIGLLGYPIPDAFIDEGLGTTASFYSGHVASVRDVGTPDETVELDLPVIPGESGAPVFTLDGKVIGMAESRFEEEHAIGFATPVDILKKFLLRER